jgi:acyl carrier protein
VDWAVFQRLLGVYTKAPAVSPESLLFGAGLDLTSIGFTEFIMALEEEVGIDIDIDDLDASVRTAGQLFDRISAGMTAGG